jgi:phosphotransferase system enzyme I (PtsI)
MVHLKGVPFSAGLARGAAYVYSDILESKQVSFHVEGERIESEWKRIQEARDSVKRLLMESAKRIQRAMGKDFSDIFLAQAAMLSDPQLAVDLEGSLRKKQINAERVVELVFQEWSRAFRAASSAVLSQRADDVDDLLRRMLGVLAGVQAHRLETLPVKSILVARRLLPSDTVFLSPASCLAILVVDAGSASHATILARELGIPCVGSLPNILLSIPTGSEILVNGNSGIVAVNPGRKAVLDFEKEESRLARLSVSVRKKRFEKATTSRGKQISVLANVSSQEDVQRAVEAGADGVGLFRTESSFLAARTLPTMEEFARYLGRCLEPLKGKPANLRLLDIGGDKNVPYISLPGELNPSLGRRGIRLLFAFPALLEIQIEAMLQVSRAREVRILVPMVTFPEEMARIRSLIEQAAAKRRIPVPPIGAMVETPAAALSVAALRGPADFLCVGTNDLTQYVMAADRESALVNEYFQDAHPVILGLLKTIVAEAGNTPVTLCGELAAKPESLARVLETGILSLSVAAMRVPEVKAAIRAPRRD